MLKRIVLSILFIISTINSNSTDPFLLKVRENLNRIKPFSVTFINRVITDSTIDIEEKGVMTFKDSMKVKWEYLEPDHKIWILRGDSYEYYDEEDEQITRGKLAKKARLWLFQLLYDRDLNSNLTINKKTREIHFLNSDEGVNFKILFSENMLPEKVIQKDPAGVDIVYLFSDYKKNIKLSADEFKLKIEGDIDIIELE